MPFVLSKWGYFMDSGSLNKECSCSYTLPDSCHPKLHKPFARSQSTRKLHQSCHKRVFTETRHIPRDRIFASAADLSAGAPQEDEEPPELNEIFPRIREGNPYRYFDTIPSLDSKCVAYKIHCNHAPIKMIAYIRTRSQLQLTPTMCRYKVKQIKSHGLHWHCIWSTGG